MLTQEQIFEVREHLDRAQNPLFYYDNDADGLCSFLILRRALGRGKGVAIRSYPELNQSYASKASELKADYVFILDKPLVSKKFVEEIANMGLPLVWIDHHAIDQGWDVHEFSNLSIYNSALNSKAESGEPVTYISYKLTGRKEDLWIAVMGCVADHYMPDFTNEFAEEYPNFWVKNAKEPFDVYYGAEIGKIARSLNFGLKDSTSHIVQMQNFLISCKGPEDVFAEVKENKSFREKYADIRKKYDSLFEKAKTKIDGKVLFFEYSGDLSISADLANELYYENKNKYIAVIYKKGTLANVSLRGKKVKPLLASVLSELGEGSGGGHEDAVGARISTKDIDKFRELLLKNVGI